ncbi:hypothetical protein [Cellulosilyticum ruminicola]|uniref:hypothetical protein n=1 Tax=Cellulosilyticum ruminicola TaxID=425254 RepID=UPI0006D1F451|nr:hypothetical protein [Cellulosilyticum ruminicola]
MNKFDKYYLRQGRLELSMLDEDDDKKVKEREKAILSLEEDNGVEAREPRIRLTDDIYNTLQTMGKFLTEKEEETVNQRKIEEVLGSTMQVSSKRYDCLVNGEVVKSVQAKQLEDVVRAAKSNSEISNVKEVSPIINFEEAIKGVTRFRREAIFEDDNYEDKQLAQSSIDQILLEYFGEVKPRCDYTKRLKQHIDEKIELIKNYQ